MPAMHAEFSDQFSAVAAMDKLIGRGLGRARVESLIERPSEPNEAPLSPADLGRARLEVELDGEVSETELQALLESLGATVVGVTDTPSGGQKSLAVSDDAAASAIEASRRGSR